MSEYNPAKNFGNQNLKKVTSNTDLSSLVYGKVQPQAIPLEQAVLGAIMIDRDALTSVLDILQPEAFYKTAHQVIYRVMMNLFDKSQPIDILTVNDGSLVN